MATLKRSISLESTEGDTEALLEQSGEGTFDLTLQVSLESGVIQMKTDEQHLIQIYSVMEALLSGLGIRHNTPTATPAQLTLTETDRHSAGLLLYGGKPIPDTWRDMLREIALWNDEKQEGITVLELAGRLNRESEGSINGSLKTMTTLGWLRRSRANTSGAPYLYTIGRLPQRFNLGKLKEASSA